MLQILLVSKWRYRDLMVILEILSISSFRLTQNSMDSSTLNSFVSSLITPAD